MLEYYNEENLDQKTKQLTKVEFLADFTPQELRELAPKFKYECYTRGYEIIRQGESHRRLYILTHGRVEALVTKEGRDPMPINIYRPMTAIGEISLLTGRPAKITMRCAENCEFLVLEAQSFALMLVRWPKLYQRFIEKLSQRLNQTNDALWEAKYKEFLRSAMQLSAYEERFYGVWGGKGTTGRINAKIDELSQSNDNLLIVGEEGTGRQMMAWFIHKKRFGKTAPFVVIEGQHFDTQWGESLDSLLTVMGSGTLFIKKPHLISPQTQRRLAEYLSDHHDTTVIATLNQDPEKLQTLTSELLSCFNQKFHITPLRERKRDIPAIAQGVIEYQAKKANRSTPALDREATKVLLSHHYRQGNTTELIQIMERAFSLAEEDTIRAEHIFFGPTAKTAGRSLNLLEWKPLWQLIHQGRALNFLRGLISAAFILIILIMLSAQDSRFALGVFATVWGLWWPGLVIISPFIGRIWCTICPFSYVMELGQKLVHFNRPVPDLVKKFDYLMVTFLFVFIFWIEVVTEMRVSPVKTAVLILIITLAAVVTGMIFTRHTWCKHLCPIGGLVGTASIGALMEVRADPTVCLNKCTSLDCYVGNDQVQGCPMFQHLPYLDNNLACKMCLNCVRSCPNDNVQLNLRLPGREIWNLVRVNQGFAIFIGACLATIIPLNLFESLQGFWPHSQWLLYFSICYWGAALIGGLLAKLIVRPNSTKAASKRVKLAFALIPLLMAGHIMFQLHFIPGAESLAIGLGLRANGEMLTRYLPLYQVGQVLALVIGFALTLLAVIMVLQKYRHGSHGPNNGNAKPASSDINRKLKIGA